MDGWSFTRGQFCGYMGAKGTSGCKGKCCTKYVHKGPKGMHLRCATRTLAPVVALSARILTHVGGGSRQRQAARSTKAFECIRY